jgi:hypothetical protein
LKTRQPTPYTRNRDVQPRGNFSQRSSFPPQFGDSFHINNGPRSPDAFSHGPGMRHSSPDSFRNQVPLKLSHGTDNMKEELPSRCSRVDTFGQADKIDSESVEFIQALNQVFQGTSKAIELPDDSHIEHSLTSVPHQCVELGPMTLCPTDSCIGAVIAASETFAGEAAQVVELDFAVLVRGAYSGIQRHDFGGFFFHETFLVRLDRLEFFLEQPHGLVTVEEYARRTKPAILKRPVCSGQKDGGFTLTNRARCSPELPQSRLEDYFILYILGRISLGLRIDELVQPAALFPLFNHVLAPLEMDL